METDENTWRSNTATATIIGRVMPTIIDDIQEPEDNSQNSQENTQENSLPDIISETENSLIISRSFFERLKENIQTEELPDTNDLKQALSVNTINYSDFTNRLRNVVQDRVKVKEVTIETEVDITRSISNMRAQYQREVENKISIMNNRFEVLAEKLTKTYKQTIAGEKLTELVNIVGTHNWSLIMKPNSVNLVYFYNPYFQLVRGVRTDLGEAYLYKSPVCLIKAIYFNILHESIGGSTIRLSLSGRHPNVEHAEFGTSCPGNLADEKIPLDNPQELLTLLNRVKKTYETAHLESSYYRPTIEKERIPLQTWQI